MAMTRGEAIEYINHLKKELEQTALQYGLEESIGTYIVDNYITVLPENARREIIFLGEDPASYNAANIKIDLKKALIAGFEMTVSTSKPESIFNYIQLVIVSALLIQKSEKQAPGYLEAYVVFLLHKKRAYDTGVDEEKFICEMQEWYQCREGKNVDRKDIVDAINNLYGTKTADFNNGNICLKEKIYNVIRC